MKNTFFLTDKVKTKTWEYVVAVFSGMMILGSLILIVDPESRENEEISPASYAVMLGFFICVLAVFIFRIYIRSKAKDVSFKLAHFRQNEVPFDIFLKSCRFPLKTLDRLTAKGYLQNVAVDYSSNKVLLALPAEAVEHIEYVIVECPSCGASNKVQKGKTGKCEFCDRPLSGE